ncbi:hypothetical protein C8F01DRAFT_1097753 [Mycena amicta]|nr:hypothetical protein C8F01DRAFT_1097753 [Mycena amicta]
MPSKRRARRARDARTLLSVELWERILRLVPSTEDLLTRLAGVCTLYNELCIRICLERQGVYPDDLQKSILDLSGAITRPICRLPSTRTFAARQVNCRVDPATMASELRRLDETLERCGSLVSLSIALQSDPFQVPQTAREAVLFVFCELLSKIAARNSAPVFVLMGADMFSCMPEDISLWKLHQFEFNPPPPSSPAPRSWLLPPADVGFFKRLDKRLGYIWTRLHTGNSARVHKLTSLDSVDLTLVEESAPERSLQPFNLLTLNRASITSLVLGSRPKEFVPYFTSMLWHISLPNLRNLDIFTDEIDPAALHNFLGRHPLIEHVDFALSSNDNAILHPLLDAPLAHPNMVSLFARANAEPCAHPIIRFLCDSPKIRTFGFALDPFGPASHAHPFLRDLRHIASRACPEPVELNLFLQDFRSWWDSLRAYVLGQQPLAWAHTADALTIAARMHNVHKLTISLSSVQTADQLFPWLAAFPAVQEIDFTLAFVSSGEAFVHAAFPAVQEIDFILAFVSSGEAFVHAARKALPNVPRILCYDYNGHDFSSSLHADSE